MAWQLIYTSAARGLVPGRSGFCTVARHREIRDALVTGIERVSQYGRSSRSAVGPPVHPVIFSHRVIAIGSSVYHVLSRIRDAGSDYTGRTNHLAHHLICEQHEIAAAPSPAEILLQMPWRDTAPETPRFFTDADVINLSHFHTSLKLPAVTWGQLTGDAGSAAVPFEGAALAGCYWIRQPEGDQRLLLKLFAESLLLLNPRGNTPEKLWQFPFTTFFQGTDSAADFLWRGCWPESRSMIAAAQIIDLTRPRSLAAPQNSIAEFARKGGTAFDAPSIFAQVPEPEFGIAEPEETISDTDRPAATGEELDIESLIAKADAKHGGKAAGFKPWQRKPPKGLLIVGLALLPLLSLALLTYFLREKFAEEHLGSLAKLRQENKLAEASKEAEVISGFLRGHDALSKEIERVTIASALAKFDNAADPDKAQACLDTLQYGPAWPAIMGDTKKNKPDKMLIAKVKDLREWVARDQEVKKLGEEISSADLREPEKNQKIRNQLTGLNKAIQEFSAATKTNTYGQAVSRKFRAVQGSYLEARLSALEKLHSKQDRPDDFSRQLKALEDDAKQFGAFDATQQVRFEKLDPKTPVAQGGAPDKPPVPPPNPAAVPAPVLGAMVTYIAFATADVFKISAVNEMSGGQQWPDPALWKIELHRQATTPSAPAPTGQPCTILGKKLYVGAAGTQEVLTLTEQTLGLKDAELKKGNFILRFTNSKDSGANFQIFCFQANAPNAPVAEEPLAGSLQRKDEKTLELSKALMDKLWLNAATGIRTLVVKADGLGEDEKDEFPVKEEAGIGRIDLRGAINDAEKSKPSAPAPAAAPEAEAKKKAIQDGYDLLMLKSEENNKIGFRNLGRKVFDEKLPEHELSRTFEKYLQGSGQKTRPPSGKEYGHYTTHVLEAFLRQIKAGIKENNLRLSKFDADAKKDPAQKKIEKKKLEEQKRQLVKEEKDVSDIVTDLNKLLAMPGLPPKRMEEIINIWKKAGTLNIGNWKDIFTPDNIAKIHPYLISDGGNPADAGTKAKKVDAKPEGQAKSIDEKLAKLKTGDVKALAPFLILMKWPPDPPNGSPPISQQKVPIVKIAAQPAPGQKEPAPTPPPK